MVMEEKIEKYILHFSFYFNSGLGKEYYCVYALLSIYIYAIFRFLRGV